MLARKRKPRFASQAAALRSFASKVFTQLWLFCILMCAFYTVQVYGCKITSSLPTCALTAAPHNAG